MNFDCVFFSEAHSYRLSMHATSLHQQARCGTHAWHVRGEVSVDKEGGLLDKKLVAAI